MKFSAPIIRISLVVLALGLGISSHGQTPAPAPAAGPTPGPAPATPAAAPALDFGDNTSATITSKAWGALDAKNYPAVKAYTDKCIALYQAQALTMQASLKEPAPKETANQEWALNDVGTCYFIAGKALDDQGDKKGAIAAYKVLAEKLSFAQCWDPQGWFWKPADAARTRLAQLQFDAAQ